MVFFRNLSVYIYFNLLGVTYYFSLYLESSQLLVMKLPLKSFTPMLPPLSSTGALNTATDAPSSSHTVTNRCRQASPKFAEPSPHRASHCPASTSHRSCTLLPHPASAIQSQVNSAACCTAPPLPCRPADHDKPFSPPCATTETSTTSIWQAERSRPTHGLCRQSSSPLLPSPWLRSCRARRAGVYPQPQPPQRKSHGKTT